MIKLEKMILLDKVLLMFQIMSSFIKTITQLIKKEYNLLVMELYQMIKRQLQLLNGFI